MLQWTAAPRRIAILQSGETMTDNTRWESFKAGSGSFADKIRNLVHEGNIRRVIIQHEGRTVAEFPLTAAVVGAALAPVLAAIGAVVALLKDCTIQVERENAAPGRDDAPRAGAA
jgi:hypothetical protein